MKSKILFFLVIMMIVRCDAPYVLNAAKIHIYIHLFRQYERKHKGSCFLINSHTISFKKAVEVGPKRTNEYIVSLKREFGKNSKLIDSLISVSNTCVNIFEVDTLNQFRLVEYDDENYEKFQNEHSTCYLLQFSNLIISNDGISAIVFIEETMIGYRRQSIGKIILLKLQKKNWVINNEHILWQT